MLNNLYHNTEWYLRYDTLDKQCWQTHCSIQKHITVTGEAINTWDGNIHKQCIYVVNRHVLITCHSTKWIERVLPME